MKDFPLPVGITMVAYINELGDDETPCKEPDAWQFRDVTITDCEERMRESKRCEICQEIACNCEDRPLVATGRYRVIVRTEGGLRKRISIRSLFIRTSVASPHGLALVAKHMGLIDAAETPYSAKPLWWQDKDFVRVASELEVHLFHEGFVPKAGWKLINFDDGSEIPSNHGIGRTVYAVPARAMMTYEEKKAERKGKAAGEIASLEARRADLKKAIRMLSAEATKIRLKLAILTRVR